LCTFLLLFFTWIYPHVLHVISVFHVTRVCNAETIFC
jgi:hypothetical protein